ncbi:MAG TPA: outer membrane beta-barrel protein [Polyangiaceae bacterium]|nr:outer membrane beta-barrel protein [Polyangiaceae bacterium]
MLTKITALAAALVASLLVCRPASAQSAQSAIEERRPRRIEVVGYGGVGFTADIGVSSDVQGGNVSFDSAPVYGGLLGFRVQPNGYAYFSYSRTQTTAYFRPAGGFDTSGQTDVSFDYFQIGGNLEARHGRVVPYLGLSIGATRLAPIDGSGSDLSFSAVLDGGVKIMLTDFLDLRVIGRMPVSFVSGDASALCVSGLGCAFHYSGQPLLQGQALLGLGLHL